MSILNKIFTILLLISLLGAVGLVVYILASPKIGGKFTEFYILGCYSKAQDYPNEFIMAESEVILVKYGDTDVQKMAYGSVTMVIVNREHKEAYYAIRILMNGKPTPVYFEGNKLQYVGPITLVHEEIWEHEIGFAPDHIGSKQKVEFVLYKDSVPYLEEPLYLWIDVKIQD